MSKMTPTQRVATSRAARLLDVFRQFDTDMTMGEATAFLLVAQGETEEGGIGVTDVSRTGNFPLSTTSRYIQSLGEMDRHHKAGKKWISDHVDPMERRKKVLRLTPAGRLVLEKIQSIVDVKE